MNLNNFFKKLFLSLSHVQHIIFISAGSPFRTLGLDIAKSSIFTITRIQYSQLQEFYRTTKVNKKRYKTTES